MKINAWIGMSCLGILFWTGCSNDNDSIDMEKVWQEERETIWAYLDKNANGEVIKYAYTAGSLTDTIYMFDLEGGSAECGDAAWALVDYDIYSIGRYGSWIYCSIEDNIKEARSLIEHLL